MQRAERARRTRRRIIDAATALFLERGYAGAKMRAIAAAAGVAVPTVELGFGTKATLLKAAIDVAIAGDDEPVPVLDRAWAEAARRAAHPAELLEIAAEVITAAQSRSAGLVLAVFEGGRTDPDLAALATQLADQRAGTARWLVDALAAIAPPHAEAVDDLWLLMDPAIYDRLVRHRGWTPQRYGRWFARSAHALLYPGRNP
jgi:AcrR family transcriptional regulator